ncbi:MAG: hypothetical protein WCD32_09695, partial [Azonexus sp.]
MENAAFSGVFCQCIMHQLSGFPVWSLNSHRTEVAVSIIALPLVSNTIMQLLFTPDCLRAQWASQYPAHRHRDRRQIGNQFSLSG